MAGIEAIVANQLIQATQRAEEQLDAEIEKLDKLDLDDLEALKEKRLKALKKQASQKQDWISKGHGEYSELTDEKEFFNASQKSANVVCHFYCKSTFRCKIVDKHLDILAKKHVETRFCKIDAEKSPFLVTRLKIKVMPTIVLIKDGVVTTYIVGFDTLGGVDDFPTEMMAWRLAKSKMINYSGDIEKCPMDPFSKKSPGISFLTKKTIKDDDSDSGDDNDW